MSKSERWSSASSDSDVSFVLFGGNSRAKLLCKSLSSGIVFGPLSKNLRCTVYIGRTNGLYDMISIWRCNIAYISRYTGDHRGEIQGSNAIHEILKERIAFLSGIHATARYNNTMSSHYYNRGRVIKGHIYHRF